MDYYYGALLGVFIGDAAGATLEFMSGKRKSEEALIAMRMPGGGAMTLGKGQLTDDSELSIASAYALANGFDINRLAAEYHDWFNSDPFDIGNTCRNAFCHTNADTMKESSLLRNMKSESNGALMKIMPLAIYTSNKQDSELIRLVTLDTQLSHPNKVTISCNIVYALAIKYLLNNPKDNKGCISFIDSKINELDLSPVVIEWYNASKTLNMDSYNALHQIGHVKHAFLFCFYFLNKNESFELAIKQTLMQGGDTDTNAAIVGGLLGALHGIEAIPMYMKTPVLAFDCSHASNHHARPYKYNASHYKKLVNDILKYLLYKLTLSNYMLTTA